MRGTARNNDLIEARNTVEEAHSKVGMNLISHRIELRK